MAKHYKVIQLPVNNDLLQRLDDESKRREQSRSAFIREACVKYLATVEKDKMIEEYIRGYERFPEDEKEEAWAKMGEERLAEVLAEDSW